MSSRNHYGGVAINSAPRSPKYPRLTSSFLHITRPNIVDSQLDIYQHIRTAMMTRPDTPRSLSTLSASSADREFFNEPYNPLYNLFNARPVLVHQCVAAACDASSTSLMNAQCRRNTRAKAFGARPFLGPLLFDNNDSDARDHCAAERSA